MAPGTPAKSGKRVDKSFVPHTVILIMPDDHYQEFISKRFLGLSILLTLIFWAAFTRMLVPFVPAQTPLLQVGFAAFTAACLAGVFFLATHMFQIVLKENRKAQRERQVD